MPRNDQRTTTPSSQVDIQQAKELAATVNLIENLPRWMLLLVLDEARKIAKTSLERWNTLTASGDSDPKTLATAEAIAISAAVSVQQIEKFVKGEVRSLVLENDVPYVAPMPADKQ